MAKILAKPVWWNFKQNDVMLMERSLDRGHFESCQMTASNASSDDSTWIGDIFFYFWY